MRSVEAKNQAETPYTLPGPRSRSAHTKAVCEGALRMERMPCGVSTESVTTIVSIGTVSYCLACMYINAACVHNKYAPLIYLD